MKDKSCIFFADFLIITLLIIGFTNSAKSNPTTSSKLTTEEFSVEIRLPQKEYAEGDTLKIFLLVENFSDKPIYVFSLENVCTHQQTESKVIEKTNSSLVLNLGGDWYYKLGHYNYLPLLKINSKSLFTCQLNTIMSLKASSNDKKLHIETMPKETNQENFSISLNIGLFLDNGNLPIVPSDSEGNFTVNSDSDGEYLDAVLKRLIIGPLLLKVRR